MKPLSALLASTAVAVVMMATKAEASTADFTANGAVWGVTNAATRTSLSPIGVFGTVTAVASPPSISHTNFDGNSGNASYPLVCGPLACTRDGFGVGANDDEITSGNSESLTVTFANKVTVTDIYLLDFFSNNAASGDNTWTEVANVTIGGTTKSFLATATGGDTTGGFRINSAALIAAFGALPFTNSIVFTAPTVGPTGSNVCPTSSPNCNDYAVAGISAVPIPAALPLLGSAVGGLGLAAWRKRRAAA